MKHAARAMLSGAIGAALVLGGKLVGAVQVWLGVERRRALTDAERRLLEDVFRGSLDLARIRIVAGRAGVLGIHGRAVCVGDVVYMKRIGAERWSPVLVHECVHVWQYQRHGPRYASEALAAQLRLGRAAYDWQRELPKRWLDFNREAQAELVSDVYRYGGAIGVSPAGEGRFFAADRTGAVGTFVLPAAGLPAPHHLAPGDFTALANEMLHALRGA